MQVGHLVCLLHCGNMPDGKVRKSTQLFAEQVMPRVRHIWEEYEDHWSPKPLAAEQVSPLAAPAGAVAGAN